MLAALARFAVRHAKKIVVLALLLGVATGIVGSSVARALDPGGFEVRGGEAQRTAARIEDRFGHGAADLVALVHAEGIEASSPEMTAAIDERVARLLEDPAVAAVDSPRGPAGAAMISKDGKTAMLAIALRGSAKEKEEAYDRVVATLGGNGDGVEVDVGGALAVAVVGQQTAEHDLVRAELVAFPLVAALLALFFGGRIAALLPLVVGGLAIVFATALLRGLSEVASISVFALNIVTLLGLGLAIDYSLFMVQRFREELAFGTVEEAITRTATSAGKTMLFSGIAVAVSLLALLVFPIALLHSIAIAGALIVSLTVLASLAVLPAMLAWLGHRIEWPRRPKPTSHDEATEGRGWSRLARWVMRRPGLVAIGTTALLLFIGSPTLRLDTQLSDARIFPREFEVREVHERLVDPAGFDAGDTVQYAILLEGEGMIAQPEQLAHLDATRAALANAPDVVYVVPQIDDDAALVWVTARAADAPPGRAAQVQALRDATKTWRKVSIGGNPMVAHEVDEALLDGAAPASIIVVVVTLVVLTLAFGAIVVAIKAVIMNVLSLAASFGAMVWIFQDGRLQGVLDYQATGTIDPLILLVMFAIVFGLSMDYELFLLSRIREDYGTTGDAVESVSRGLAATGRLITMAGLMLIVVLAGFGTASVLFVKQLGIGMAIAVAIDATIVRGLLVPATMALLGRWNWWAARWFSRWWTRSNIGVRELPPGATPIAR